MKVFGMFKWKYLPLVLQKIDCVSSIKEIYESLWLVGESEGKLKVVFALYNG